MAQRTVIEVGPRGGQRVGRYMGSDGKIHWIYLGKGGAGVGAGLEHGHAAPDDAPAEEHRAQPAHETHGHVHKDPRIPPVGTVVTGTYKGQQHKVTVTATGYRYEGNGQEYRSLSQLATELADSRQNGFRFFGLHEDAGVDRRRKEAGAGEADPKAKRTVALSAAGQQAAQAAAQAPAGPQPRTVALAPGASSTAPAGGASQAAATGGRAEAPEAERRPPEASPPPAEQPGGVDEGKAARRPPDAEPGAFSYMGPGQPNDAAQFEADEHKDGRVRLKHPNGLKSGWMPEESVQHFKNDLHAIVDVPHAGADVPHADLINAVSEGRARFLGKGDDGMAFRVGDQVVKVSTTVPFQPTNGTFEYPHLTPQQAADRLKSQVDTANKLADAGVPYVQRSEFVQHGDKGFQIKPYVEIPKKFTREQLDKIQAAMHAMHEKGFAMQDEFQAGVDAKGDPVLFDTGKAEPRGADDDAKDRWSKKAGDIENLRLLYRRNGEEFVNTKDPEWKQHAAHNLGLKLVEKMDKGHHDFAAHQVDEVDAMRRHDARATLTGDELRAALEDIDIDRDRQLAKIAKHREKWDAEQPATYGGQNRPLGFGTVPKGHTAFGEHPDFRHGTVTYDKPLDPKEARSYQLDRVVDPKQHGWIARQVADKMAPDAAEYLEYSKDDPEAFQQGLRQHVADYLHENGLHADVEAIAGTVAKRLEEHVQRQGPPAEETSAVPTATATAMAPPQTPEKLPESAPQAAPTTPATTATSEPPPAAPASPQGGLPQRPDQARQGDLLPRERGQLTLTAPEAPAQRRAAPEQPSLFGGAPERPAAEPEAPARTNPDEVTTDEQAQRQAAAEESARRRRKPGEPEAEASAPSSQEPAPKPAPEDAARAPQAAETQSQTSQAPAVQEPPPAEAPKPTAAAPKAALASQDEALTAALARHGHTHEPHPNEAKRASGHRIIRDEHGATVGEMTSNQAWKYVGKLNEDAKLAAKKRPALSPDFVARQSEYEKQPIEALRQRWQEVVGEPAPPQASILDLAHGIVVSENFSKSAPAPEAASPAVQAPRSEATLPPAPPEHPPEARGANQPRTTGNEEQRQGRLTSESLNEMTQRLRPARDAVDAAKTPGERLKALTAEYVARSEHGRQLAGMGDDPLARQALTNNRDAMGQINAEIGKLRAAGAGEKPAPSAAPAESQAEMAESRGRLSVPGPAGKPRTVVTLKGAQMALENARKRTDLTAAAQKAASEALGRGDFTAAREALAKGSTDRYRKTALEYVDRLEDAATGKSGVERAADRELAGTAPPPTPDRRLPVGEAAALAGLAPAGRQEVQAPHETAGGAGGAGAPAPQAAKAPPSPQEAAAAAKPGEYHQAIADHAAAHLSAAEERARPDVERILQKVGGPAALGEKLPSDPERRATALGRWAAHVYEKMGPELVAAGLDPHAAQGLITHTLERSNWHPEAKAALLAHISGERGKRLAPAAATIGDAAENLAGGDETRAGHVQQAVDIYDGDWTARAQKGEVAAARVSDLVQKARQADTPEAREQAQRALAEALGPVLDLVRAGDAFPGYRDRALQPAREALAAASTLGRTKPTRDGAPATLLLPGEDGRPERLAAQYRLVDAADLTPSHDPLSFAAHPNYPTGLQEREYHRDKSEQAKVRNNAQHLIPEFVANTNADAINGPPMALPNGIVLGGNSRTMALQRAYENHPEAADRYRQHLADTAHHYGFRPEDVAAMKRPILVRTVEPKDTSHESLQGFVRRMNEGFTQAMDPAAEAVAKGRMIRPEAIDQLASSMQPEESLSDFLDGAGARPFVEELRRAGIISRRNENQYLTGDPRNNKLNEDGKTLVSRAVVGRVLEDADLIRNTPPSLVENIARVVPTMLQAEAAGDRYSLAKPLRHAIHGLARLRSWGRQDPARKGETHGALSAKSDPKHWERGWAHLERGLLSADEGAHPAAKDPAARQLVELLVKRGGPRQLPPVFEEYARLAKEKGSAGQNDMFGGSPEGAGDLLRRAIQNVEAHEGEVKAERAATKAEKEQKAREKVIEEHERAKAEAAAPAEAAPAPPSAEPPPDPQQAAEEARAARKEADRKAAEEQAARDKAEANRNQTSLW